MLAGFASDYIDCRNHARAVSSARRLTSDRDRIRRQAAIGVPQLVRMCDDARRMVNVSIEGDQVRMGADRAGRRRQDVGGETVGRYLGGALRSP
jgi:hypothetical protein